MIRAGLLAGTLLLGGCVYLNTLYNARTQYRMGEQARMAGRGDDAREAFVAARDKAARSFVADSSGPWAPSALLLLGKAHLRLGAYAEAEAALEQAVAVSTDRDVQVEAGLYLGAVRVARGEYPAALVGLNSVLPELASSELRGEGHLWRARALLGLGRADQGWWDLNRAVEADARLGSPAHLERIGFAVRGDDPGRAEEAVQRLFRDPEAGIWADSVSRLVSVAAQRWSPGDAAALLANARGAPWAPGPRTGLLLQRIELLLEAGDTLAAETELGWVAQSRAGAAVPARLALARLRLRRATSVVEFQQVRRILLPAASEPDAVQMLETLRQVELLAGEEESAFEARFAGAELAREELQAPALARLLYLQAATAEDGGVWRGKAALAARSLDLGAADTGQLVRELLREGDPYLTRAWNRYLPSDTLRRLDQALQPRLERARAWASDEAQRRDVQIRGQSRREPATTP